MGGNWYNLNTISLSFLYKGKSMESKYSAKQIKAAVTALKNYKEKPFVKHEWEELVLRLSRDNDPELRERMFHEMEEIMEKDPGFRLLKRF